MQTQTHTLLALAALARRESPRRNLAVAAGSLVPDLFIYLAWPWLTFVRGESQERIWREIYFDAPMQAWGALLNSAPLYAALALAGWLMRGRVLGVLLLVFSLAALIHVATDLPVHAEDAHRHFWPLTDWRFHSPVSYWNPAYHARWVGSVESVLGLGLCAVLWRRFPARWARVMLALLALFYFATLVARWVPWPS